MYIKFAGLACLVGAKILLLQNTAVVRRDVGFIVASFHL